MKSAKVISMQPVVEKLETQNSAWVFDVEQGSVVLFPSYVLHEVKPVTHGARYSLVSWITGKPFR